VELKCKKERMVRVIIKRNNYDISDIVSLYNIYGGFILEGTPLSMDASSLLRQFFKGQYFSTITFLTIDYGDIQPPNDICAIIASLEGFSGLFLMSFFTVSVARKTLR